MAANMTTAYAEIIKYDKNDDGTLVVYGKATDDSVDIDQQICDAAWLDRAMPEWFKSGGNIREQHSNIAAGVAQEYEQKGDGHYISALVVDPVSVKKVENRVLKGFSIGIKSPRVVRDQKAANGRIIDGQIVEVSLVDRPANPNCQLVLAKSVAGETTLVKSEDLIEKHGDHDQADHNPNGGGGDSTRDDDKVSDAKESVQSLRDELSEHADNLDDQMGGEGDPEDHPDAQAIERASESLDRAEALMSRAENAKDTDRHQDLLERAEDHLSDAYNAISHASSETRDSFLSGIDSVRGEVNDYLDALSNSDKSTRASIRKHGDHDQSDHNPNAGGGGKDKEDTPSRGAAIKEGQSTLKDTRNTLEKEYVAAAKDKDTDRDDLMDLAQEREDADSHLMEAAAHLGQGSTTGNVLDFARGATSMRNAAEILRGSANNGYRSAGKELSRAADKIESTISKDKSATTQKGSKMEQIKTIVEAAKALTGDKVKFDHASYETARRALADLIVVEGQELGEGHDERGSLRALFTAVEALLAWREGEEWEGEVPGAEEVMEELKATAGDDTTREENTGEVCDKCGKAADECKCADKELVAEDGEEVDAEKSTEGEEAPAADADEAKEEAPADAEATTEFVTEESDMSKALLADPKFLEVVETAVKSAIGKVETEVTELKSALEAAENKATELETELAAAKSLAIGGGPKRAAIATGTPAINEWSVKGNEMLQKAASTPDTLLAQGYRDMAKDFFAKAVSTN